MLRSMFSRLMAVIMAAILVVVIGITALFYVTSRSNYIDSRMNELKVQAYEIAYLASQVRTSALSAFGYDPIACQKCHKRMSVCELRYNHKHVSLHELYEKTMLRSKIRPPTGRNYTKPSLFMV